MKTDIGASIVTGAWEVFPLKGPDIFCAVWRDNDKRPGIDIRKEMREQDCGQTPVPNG